MGFNPDYAGTGILTRKKTSGDERTNNRYPKVSIPTMREQGFLLG